MKCRTKLLGLVASLFPLAACSVDRDPRSGVKTGALISDEARNGATGLFFLPPLVPQPTLAGTFVADLSPVVEIDEIDPNTSGLLRVVATYTTTSGPGSETVRVNPEEEHYIVNWHTNLFSLSPTLLYRIKVLIGAKTAGFADVVVVESGAQLKNVDSGQYVGLVDGRTLPIKFFLNQCAPVVCTADQCHVAGTCAPTSGVCSDPTVAADGTACDDGDQCTATDTCQAGTCQGSPFASPVARDDYVITYPTSDMPDPGLNGLSADLDVHRVTPGPCPGTKAALVLVHGRTIPGTAAFDLQYSAGDDNYSMMEALAKRGIDTFAFNHLGFGLSKIKTSADDPMVNACNASLPRCTGADGCGSCTSGSQCNSGICSAGKCAPVSTCDCQTNTNQTMNQQSVGCSVLMTQSACQGSEGCRWNGSTCAGRYLKPADFSPSSPPCAHTIKAPLQQITNLIADLDRVVEDARGKTQLAKVDVLGWSAGGVLLGPYLAGIAGVSPSHQDKVERAIFLASNLNNASPPALQAWPLGVIDRDEVLDVFKPGASLCTGQARDQAFLDEVDAIWTAIRARDLVAGPDPGGWGPGGLSRFENVRRWGWTLAAAQTVTVPVLSMNGLKDGITTPVTITKDIYDNVNSAGGKKLLVQLECATHALVWERCQGDTCGGSRGPYEIVRRIIGDYVLTGKVFAGSGYDSGSFRVAENGTVTPQ